jgi:hypothetical protein
MRHHTPDSTRLAKMLYAVEADLDTFTIEPVLAGDLSWYYSVCSDGPFDDNGRLSDELQRLFSSANDVITSYSDVDVTPNFQLTHRAVKAALEPDTPVCVSKNDDQLCFEAELRLEGSLRYNEQDKILPDGHVPAAVVFDVNGAPFGYFKSSGRHVGFAWKGATVNTETGYRHIPGASFFDLKYGVDGEEDIQAMYREYGTNSGLISLEKTKLPTVVRLLRFSTFLLSHELANVAYLYAVGPEASFSRTTELGGYIKDVLRLNPKKVGERVCALLQNGKAQIQ